MDLLDLGLYLENVLEFALNNLMNSEERKAEEINCGYHRIQNTIIIRGGSKIIFLKMKDKTS